MSPKVKIEDQVGRVLFDASLSDNSGSAFRGRDGSSVLVDLDGNVVLRSPQVEGAYNFATGQRVNGKGLDLGCVQRRVDVLLLGDMDGEMVLRRVSSEPLLNGRGSPER